MRSALLRLAGEWGVDGAEGAWDGVAMFVHLLLHWNARVNLTGARDAAELLGDHLPDSLAMCRLVPSDAGLVDVGSGGGLPAIPFALLRPDCSVTLVEPRAKRVAFLNTAVRVCGLRNVLVFRGRVQDLTQSRSFHVASSRATFSPSEWLALAPPLLLEGGRMIVFSGAEGLPVREMALLVDSLTYSTARGSPRWVGSYCST